MDIRALPKETGKVARHDAVGEGRHHGDAQHAGVLPADLLGKGLDAVKPDEGTLHLSQQRRRLGRRDELVSAPFEQLQLQVDLEITDQPAHRRLGDNHQLRRSGHLAGQHNQPEGFDLSKVHSRHHNIWLFSCLNFEFDGMESVLSKSSP